MCACVGVGVGWGAGGGGADGVANYFCLILFLSVWTWYNIVFNRSSPIGLH